MRFDIEEALRYLGAGGTQDQTLRQSVQREAEALTAQLKPRYIYKVVSLTRSGEELLLPEAGLSLPGRTARLMLAECHPAVVLACTLGAEFDALLRTQQARDMARAVILDACGSAWVEAGCDAAEKEIAALFPGKYLTDRFSPGYGDLPLALQPGLCRALDAPRRIGLHVTGSLLLNPAKSVTALLGVAGTPQMRRIRGCACCSMNQTCQLRKGGKTCAP